MKFFEYIIEFFTEKKCYTCGQVWHFFCQKCQENLYVYSPYCYVCKKPSKDFFTHIHCRQRFELKQCIVLTRYRHSGIKKSIRHAKYYGKYPVYHDIISYLWKRVSPSISPLPTGILIPVPMHRFRKWKRWYNQAEKIAEILSVCTWFAIDTILISRTRRTKQQSHLSQSERLSNLSGAFHIQSHHYTPDTPLYLVDDVISTGSTLSEIAKTLQKAGFTDIRAIVIASD